MSLGAGALKVSRGAKCNKQRGGIHGNPGSGNHSKKPVSRCLENGGTRQQGDLVPPITQTNPQAPNNSPNYANYKGTNLADPRTELGERS